jgi:hypothetical protein
VTEVTRAFIENFLLTASIKSSRAIPLDYYSDEITGNSINSKDIGTNAILINNEDYNYHDSGKFNEYAIKRDPELFVGGQKRNIISALQAKIRRSKPSEDVEDKLRFSPVLSVGELTIDFKLKLNSNSSFLIHLQIHHS